MRNLIYKINSHWYEAIGFNKMRLSLCIQYRQLLSVVAQNADGFF